jgi:hypothetical protein
MSQVTNRTPERRKEPRMPLGIPVRIQGHGPDGTAWEEMSTTEDAYTGGVSFVLKRAVSLGHLLHLALPLPKNFRRHDLTTPSYTVYAVVRNTNPVPGGHRVGAMLLGRTPPKGYAEAPGGRFLLSTDAVARRTQERRKGGRFELPLLVRLSRTLDGQAEQEQTITRNLGLGGALVLTSLAVHKDETVLVEALDGSFRTRAAVQNVSVGKDNIPYLNLRFLDADAAEGIRAVLRHAGHSA